MAGDRGLQHPDRQGRARRLAEPHPQIEQRRLAELVEQQPVSGLGRDVRDDAMIERVRVGGVQHRGGGGRDEPVEQHRHAPHARRQHRAGDRRQLVSAEPAQQLERIAFVRMFNVPADSAASYLFTARMLLRQGFDPIAEEYAQKAVALDPKLPLAHFLLGQLYTYKSRIPEAIAEFQKELAIDPAHAPTYYELADAYSRVQKFDDAERLLQRSIWLDANSTGPYILMGKVLEKKGEYELAARALQHAVTMDPNNYVTHHLLGQTYRDLGRKEDAERELKLAEELQEKSDSK